MKHMSLAIALTLAVFGTAGCSFVGSTLVGAGIGAGTGLAVAGPPGAAVGAGAGAAGGAVVSLIN